jgi:competence protein ComEA
VHADVDERLRRLAAGWTPTPATAPELQAPIEPATPLRADHWGRRSWRGFALLLGAITLVGGWLWWQAQPREVVSAPGGGVASQVTPSAASGTVVVHVAGAVRKPGLVTLPAGARVADAIDKAGGARSPRYLASVNLARLLVDGEQILLGQSVGSGAGAGRVSLGTASATELEQLPGVGPVLAQRIVQWRTEHGPFRGIDDLSDVSGVGDALMEQIRPLVVP